nr:MAG TPA: hypothetical protein [Siphoviridae sp. ctRJB2]
MRFSGLNIQNFKDGQNRNTLFTVYCWTKAKLLVITANSISVETNSNTFSG